MNITAEFQLPSLIEIEYIDEFCIILHDEHTYILNHSLLQFAKTET